MPPTHLSLPLLLDQRAPAPVFLRGPLRPLSMLPPQPSRAHPHEQQRHQPRNDGQRREPVPPTVSSIGGAPPERRDPPVQLSVEPRGHRVVVIGRMGTRRPPLRVPMRLTVRPAVGTSAPWPPALTSTDPNGASSRVVWFPVVSVVAVDGGVVPGAAGCRGHPTHPGGGGSGREDEPRRRWVRGLRCPNLLSSPSTRRTPRAVEITSFPVPDLVLVLVCTTAGSSISADD